MSGLGVEGFGFRGFECVYTRAPDLGTSCGHCDNSAVPGFVRISMLRVYPDLQILVCLRAIRPTFSIGSRFGCLPSGSKHDVVHIVHSTYRPWFQRCSLDSQPVRLSPTFYCKPHLRYPKPLNPKPISGSPDL